MAQPTRCGWAGPEPIYLDYHDHEWGRPTHDDRALFELLSLEGMQADADVPASTPLSDRISRDLKKRGFTFVGTTIVYSLLQSAGLVDDHLKGCGWHASCRPPE